MPHFVYKYVYNGKIIYIGKTDSNLGKRLSQHGKPGDNIPKYGWEEINASDIFYVQLANSIMSDVVESELIRRYKPKYNKAKMSEWAGLPFEEPDWIAWHEHDELDDLKHDYSVLEQKYYSLKKEYEEYCEKSKRKIKSNLNNYIYNLILGKFYDARETINNLSIENGLSFEEILSEYKSTNNPIAYISQAYNKNGDLICEKIIYTSGYDSLDFAFYQYGCVEKSGCIYNTRKDETKRNYQVLRNWINRGNNIYYPVTAHDIPLIYQSGLSDHIKMIIDDIINRT